MIGLVVNELRVDEFCGSSSTEAVIQVLSMTMAAVDDSGGDDVFAATVKDDYNVMAMAVMLLSSATVAADVNGGNGDIHWQRLRRIRVKASRGEMVRAVTGKGRQGQTRVRGRRSICGTTQSRSNGEGKGNGNGNGEGNSNSISEKDVKGKGGCKGEGDG